MSLVVKIGGSVATNKNEAWKPVVLVEDIKRCLEQVDVKDLKALVFGVGAFGHKKAINLGLAEEDSAIDYSKVSAFVDELNNYYQDVMEVVLQFSDKFDFRPLKTWEDFEQIKIGEGIPVFFGSVVNKDDKATILSGDAIVSKIAGVADILFFTDVYGVALESGEVVSEFAMSDIDDVIERAIKENVEDATGGMIGKLDKLKKFGFKNRVVFRNIHQT